MPVPLAGQQGLLTGALGDTASLELAANIVPPAAAAGQNPDMSKATGDAMSAPFRRLDIQSEPILALAGGPTPYHASDFALFAAAVPDRYLATVALWRPRNAAAEFNRDEASGPLANDRMA